MDIIKKSISCAYFVAAINHEMSVGSIIDPIKKIEALLSKRQ